MNGRGNTYLLGSIALFSSLSTVPAIAQADQATSQNDSDGFGDIIVNALRREESQQRVPVVVTKLSAETLETRRVQTSQDLAPFIPSLAVSFNNSRDGTTFTIRGQGATYGANPGVVAYLNEAPLPYNNASGSTAGGPGLFLDVESIQVLNGPQGTLFGKNTTGGAVLIQSRVPTNNFEGYVQGTYGNYDNRELQAAVNVPLIDDGLLVRAAISRQIRDGFTDNVFTGERLDNRDNWSTRITFLLRPMEGLENQLIFYGSWSDSNGTGYQMTHLNPAGLAGFLYPPPATLKSEFDAQQARGIRAVASGSSTAERNDYWGFVNTTRWELSDTVTLKNIIGYHRVKSSVASDPDGSPLAVMAIAATANMSSLTEELQLQGGSLGDKLQWTVGGFLQRDKPEGNQIFSTGLLTDTPFGMATTAFNGERRKSRALYAQASLNLGALTPSLEGFKLTGGYRYTWDRFEAFSTALPFTVEQKSSASSWTVGLDYQADPVTLLYGKVSRGYKGGGFNSSSLSPTFASFEPEYVTSYEAGIKRDWTVGAVKLRTNLSAYHTKFEDIQKQASVSPTVTVTLNCCRAKIDGIEIGAALIPLPGFEISGNYSHIDARYLDSTFGVSTANPLLSTPKNKFTVAGSYEFALGDAGELALSANYSRTGSLYVDISSSDDPAGTLAGFSLLSLRADWKSIMGQPIDLGLFMTNVSNTRYRVGAFPAYNLIGISSGVYGEPRMYGVQLRYSWGS